MGVDRNPHPTLTLEKFDPVDLLNTTLLNQAVGGFRPDFIFHLAALSSVADSWQRPQECFLNNTQVFLNLLEAVRTSSPGTRILSVGSSEEYGKQPTEAMPLLEEIACNPVSPYAVARVSQSLLSRVYSDGFGLKITSTRSFNHTGPGQREQFVVGAFCKHFAEMTLDGTRTMPVGNLESTRDFSDVRDVVCGYIDLAQGGKPGEIYNVCSGKGISLGEVLLMLEDIAGFKPEYTVNPAFLRPNDPPLIYGSRSKILRDTGWSPKIPFQQTVHESYHHWLDRLKQ